MNSESAAIMRNMEVEKNLGFVPTPSFAVETIPEQLRNLPGTSSQLLCLARLSLGPVPHLGWLWTLSPPWFHVVETFTLGSNLPTFTAYTYMAPSWICHTDSVLGGCTLYKNSFPILIAGYFSLLLPDIIILCPIFCVVTWFMTVISSGPVCTL